MKTKYRDFRETIWETSGLTETEDGHLVGEIVATGAGVFSYYDDKGKVVRLLRSVDDVKAATPGIADLPITLFHPDEDVSEYNIDRLKVGSIGHEVVFDGLNNKIHVDISDPKAVEAIKKHKIRAVSMGYDCKVVRDSGNWQGVDYDARQTEIVYNHMALVPVGRAGDGVNFRVRCGDSVDFNIFNQKDNNMIKTTLRDGSIVEVEERVFDELKSYKDENKSLKDSADEKQRIIDSVTGERDAAKASLTKAEKDLAEFKAKAIDSKEIDNRVNARLALLKCADEAKIEKAAEMSDKDIKLAIIGKAYDGMNLEGKSDDYIAAMFDAAFAQLKKGVKDAADDDTSNKDLEGPFVGLDSADIKPEEAYQKMCDALSGKTKKEA